jgi:hypothetical protein
MRKVLIDYWIQYEIKLERKFLIVLNDYRILSRILFEKKINYSRNHKYLLNKKVSWFNA